MASYDEELLSAAERLLEQPRGQKGKLAAARIRRSISTSYYALFHFLVEEAGDRLVGTQNHLRRRRRILARTFSHKGIKVALGKVIGSNVDPSVREFLGRDIIPTGLLPSPSFAQNMARAFEGAQAQRHDADYDLNKPLSAADARRTRHGVKTAIAAWRAANSSADRDFKKSLCLLMLLGDHLRRD